MFSPDSRDSRTGSLTGKQPVARWEFDLRSRRWPRRIIVLSVVALGMLACAWSAEAATKSPAPKATTSALVQEALERELTGKSAERDALLQKALEQSPDDAQAHWQLGQVQVDGRWLSPEAAAQLAAQDKRLPRYQQKRDAASGSLDDEIALARWCRKNKLDDEERVHWLRTLELQPNNAEAVRGLDLRPYQGMMLTHDEIVRLKGQLRTMRQAVQHWTPLVTRWRETLRSEDTLAHKEVLDKVRSVTDSDNLLALDLAIRRYVGSRKSDRPIYRQVSEDMVTALAAMPTAPAAESLARYAVFSPFESVNSGACGVLKDRPMDHYVPLMLSWMAAPIETNFRVGLNGMGRQVAQQTFLQEGPVFNVSHTVVRGMVARTDVPVLSQLRFADLDTLEKLLEVRMDGPLPGRTVEPTLNREAAARRTAVEQQNASAREQNLRVCLALRRATDVDLDADPREWWDWWLKHNDWQDLVRQSSQKPTMKSIDYGFAYPLRTQQIPTSPKSCFAAGTKVWTLTGLVPIEQIKPGDRVLSQDVDSGELRYKPVLRLTLNPKGRMMQLRAGDETITCTPAHPMWAVGDGWRFARTLAAGDQLHALSGAVMVENVEKPSDKSPTQAAYNLIVADFSTYFVGERGLLVHDNTPRRPTSVLLPGLADRPNTTTSD
jgi:hypothetical protein